MKSSREQLLKDVLGENGYDACRAELREELTRVARRKRWRHCCAQNLKLAACLSAVAGLVFVVTRPGSEMRDVATPPNVAKSVSSVEMVARNAASVVIVDSTAGSVEIVRSDMGSGLEMAPAVSPSFELLSDSQLMTSFEGLPVALLDSSREKKLMMLNYPSASWISVRGGKRE